MSLFTGGTHIMNKFNDLTWFGRQLEDVAIQGQSTLGAPGTRFIVSLKEFKAFGLELGENLYQFGMDVHDTEFFISKAFTTKRKFFTHIQARDHGHNTVEEFKMYWDNYDENEFLVDITFELDTE